MPPASVAGTFARPYMWLYTSVLIVFLLLLWMVLVDVWCVNSVWSEGERALAAAALLENDRSIAPQPLGDRLGDLSYAAIFKLSGIDGAIVAATTPDAHLSALDDALVRGLLRPYADEVAALMQSARLAGVRLAILFNLWAFGLLVIAPAVVDGLAQRYVRRACAGPESSSLYHRAKRIQFVGGLLVAMVYLTVPAAINPLLLYVWLAVSACAAFVQCMYYNMYYKKHL